MKRILLIVSLLVICVVSGQTSINALNGTLGSDIYLSGDGQNTREDIIRYAPGSSFDQFNSGPNQVWDLTGLTSLTTFWRYSNTAPTASELSTYPGTTMVNTYFSATDNSVASKTYCSGAVSLSGLNGLAGVTGFTDAELTLNYSTNNINLGSFPLVYNSNTTSDAVEGTYTFGIYSGTFAGTFTTSVDAYGTMNTTIDGVVNVTRLKTVEALQINYPGLGNFGIFEQTTYRYYRAIDLWPYVKSTNRIISIAALGLNTNETQIEKAPQYFLLSVPNVSFDKSVSLFPNPATNTININTSQEIVSLIVVDQLGKVVLIKNRSNHLDVSALQSGTYFIKIVTESGSEVKKFMKN